jgi:hypothetical protein
MKKRNSIIGTIVGLTLLLSGVLTLVSTSAFAYLPCAVTPKAPYVDGILTHHQNATGKMHCNQNYAHVRITVTLSFYDTTLARWLQANQRVFDKYSTANIDNFGTPVQYVCVNDPSQWTWRTKVEGEAFSQDGVRRWHGSDTVAIGSNCIA